jgi:hypothetical protein
VWLPLPLVLLRRPSIGYTAPSLLIENFAILHKEVKHTESSYSLRASYSLPKTWGSDRKQLNASCLQHVGPPTVNVAPELAGGIRISAPGRIALVKEFIGSGLAPPALLRKALVLPPATGLCVGNSHETAQQLDGKG